MAVRKISFMITVLLLILTATACNKQADHPNNPPEMIEVDLSVNPKKAKPNEPVVFEAKVTQGKEVVTDADEVVFEIWRAKDEKHTKIEVKHVENGIYRLEKTFSQEGTYYIISHVTARDMHNMPKKEFVVGKPSEPEINNEKESMDEMNMEEHDPSTEGH
ncbi:FixH family protein [Bacillus thermocopriae]|uniref:FixH family protein n=1 Tax=Neobacillus thermocopriae TaxID=1215031 RepID=A0A6B3TTD2_9BACI|nr:FixH family protein [Neobacillus thermocopriae]MED3625454.1 FixH family protein [Neobacillus thermocopriae]MED3714629.1 FixH family protein [Neobacillus thermocopriae]NEX78927.1 FixH family protein [Neobacillus thermocopriae]